MLLSRMNVSLSSCPFSCRRTRGGNSERFAQLIHLGSDDCISIAATGGVHIELLLFHHVTGDNHCVNGLAFATMSSNHTAMVEFSRVRRRRPAVFDVFSATSPLPACGQEEVSHNTVDLFAALDCSN